MRCIYCDRADNDYLLLNKTASYSGIEVALNRHGNMRIRYYDDNEQNFVSQDVICINYCPYCGRPLRRVGNKAGNTYN